MPVVLPQSAYAAWLDRDMTEGQCGRARCPVYGPPGGLQRLPGVGVCSAAGGNRRSRRPHAGGRVEEANEYAEIAIEAARAVGEMLGIDVPLDRPGKNVASMGHSDIPRQAASRYRKFGRAPADLIPQYKQACKKAPATSYSGISGAVHSEINVLVCAAVLK